MTTMMNKMMTKQSRVKLDSVDDDDNNDNNDKTGKVDVLTLVLFLTCTSLQTESYCVSHLVSYFVSHLSSYLVHQSTYKKLILSEAPKHHQHKVGNPPSPLQITYFNLPLLKTNLHPLTIKRII